MCVIVINDGERSEPLQVGGLGGRCEPPPPREILKFVLFQGHFEAICTKPEGEEDMLKLSDKDML